MIIICVCMCPDALGHQLLHTRLPPRDVSTADAVYGFWTGNERKKRQKQPSFLGVFLVPQSPWIRLLAKGMNRMKRNMQMGFFFTRRFEVGGALTCVDVRDPKGALHPVNPDHLPDARKIHMSILLSYDGRDSQGVSVSGRSKSFVLISLAYIPGRSGSWDRLVGEHTMGLFCTQSTIIEMW
jgi:hypothetical protein